MRVRFLALLAALSLLVLAALPASASTSNPKFNPPKSFYLALGDSLAFGYQQSKFIANLPTENPSAFVTGYVDDFAGMLQGIDPAIETVNPGCPDETTSSFMAGGCPYTDAGFRLHRAYGGAQLDAAINFLKSHPGQVSPITIDSGIPSRTISSPISRLAAIGAIPSAGISLSGAPSISHLPPSRIASCSIVSSFATSASCSRRSGQP